VVVRRERHLSRRAGLEGQSYEGRKRGEGGGGWAETDGEDRRMRSSRKKVEGRGSPTSCSRVTRCISRFNVPLVK
jgi:hypothetical protein